MYASCIAAGAWTWTALVRCDFCDDWSLGARAFGGIARSPSNFSAELPADGWSDYLRVAAKQQRLAQTFAQDRGTFAFELLTPTTRAGA